MPSLNNNPLLILAVIISIFLISPVSAVNLQSADGDNTVWTNQENGEAQFSATCTQGYERNIYLNSTDPFGPNYTISTDSSTLQTQHFSSYNLGNYQLNLNCMNRTDGSVSEWKNSSTQVKLRELSVEDLEDGQGFVGEKLSNGLYRGDSSPLVIELEVEDGEGKKAPEFFEDGNSQNFNFDGPLSLSGSDVEADKQGNSVELTLTPSVNNYFDDAIDLTIKDERGNKIDEISVSPSIHEWNANLVGGNNPSRRMSFENVLNGGYSYLLEMDKVSDTDQPILSDVNFRLSVKVKEKGKDNYVDVGDLDSVDDMKNKKWLKWEEPGGQVGNYRVKLDNIKELKDLPDRQYKFLLKFYRTGDSVSEKFTVDQVLVDKESMFSGKVIDDGGAGVETLMKLRSPDRNVRINTGKDGRYSKEINSDAFDSMVLEYYKRGKSYPDGSVVVSDPSLASGSDLGEASSALKFDYWSDPSVDIMGVDPVNMMAVKFGYPIKSFDNANIRFDPAGINFENLQVYECSGWNFEGRQCLTNWTQLDENDFSVNVGKRYEVHVSELSPYSTPSEEDILLNAYVLGTSADIGLRDSLDIEGPVNARIPKQDSIRFKGFIETQKGNPVSEGIPVEVKLKSPTGTEPYTGETDVNGKFVINGKAPDQPGNYTVRVSSDPEIFSGFSIKYTKPLSVYTEKEVSLELPETFEMQKGKEKVMEFSVKNTGQAEVEINDFVADGMSTDFYSWVNKFSGSIEPGESKTASIRFDIPEAYTDSYPSLGLKVEASADGKILEDSETAQIRARDTLADSNQKDETQENQETDSNSNEESDGGNSTAYRESDETSGMTLPGQSLASATGKFIESTSNMNLALGLVMVFLMIIAGAVSKKKDNTGRRSSGRSAGRQKVSSVNLAPKEKEKKEKQDEVEEVQSQQTDEQERKQDHEESISQEPDNQVQSQPENTSDKTSEHRDDENLEEKDEKDELDEPQVEQDDSSDSSENEKFIDEDTGREFDTKQALEMFQEMKK